MFPNGTDSVCDGDDEVMLIEGRFRTRHEAVLLFDGDASAARHAWAAAQRQGVESPGPAAEATACFASCTRGHLLHARCLQGALLTGRRCPAPGCAEPLWVPRVRRERRDDETCGGQHREDRRADGEAWVAAREIARDAAAGRGSGDERARVAASRPLRMCPACCAGPLCNEECSDMAYHHGQCSAVAIRGAGAVTRCTADGAYRARAGDILDRLMRRSSAETVADVLPQCPTHNVAVMFNGCLVCGHVFTGTRWTDLPPWDPNARLALELDKKKRRAAEALAKQVRAEAAMLQFERDALEWASGVL